MILKYLKYYNNWGDSINLLIAKWIFGRKLLTFDITEPIEDENCLLVGSTLEHADKNTIVWGAGFIKEKSKCVKPKKILAVRGKLTRDRLLELGYDCPEVYGDPTLLLPRYYNPKIEKKYKLGTVPHEADDFPYKGYIINVRQSGLKFVKEILECEKIRSSSLHGLIIADAYGIPSEWIKSDKVIGNGFKFRDYYSVKPDLDKLWKARPRVIQE